MSATPVSSIAAPPPSRRAAFGLLAGGVAVSLLPGCATPIRGTAVPMGQVRQASVLGLPNERFFPSYGSAALEAEFAAAGDRQRRTLGLAPSAMLPALTLLSISGGGENGAFGAGLLCGWTEQGSRPSFDLVTGVSTGALTAPFAYLGTGYDPQLRTVYTELGPKDVLAQRPLTAALFDDALTDNTPLLATISRFITEELRVAIGQAYGQGRMLLIATTNLDAQLPVLWNVGAIAASNHPRALETIRRLMLASAAIPGAFPPTMFDVTLDGAAHQEMHVDGGAFAQAFLYPASLTRLRRQRMAAGHKVVEASAYVIRNGRLDPEWASVERRTLGIASRAISTMIAASGYNDVLRMYNTTTNDGIEFNLAFIGTDFTDVLPAPFDQGFMQSLFEYGYRHAKLGYEWAHTPPI